MPYHMDITNQRFGRLTAMKRVWWEEAGRDYGKWWCKCDCGQYVKVIIQSLRRGATKSCGCLHKETARLLNRLHGGSGTREYTAWWRVIARHRKDGTALHPGWERYYRFITDMGRCPPGKRMLCRRDLNQGFNPDNCFWGTARDVAKRRKSDNGRRTISVLPARVDSEVSAVG